MNKYSEIYKNRSDKELVTILTESHKYNEEAIAACRIEITSRGIPEDAQTELRNAINKPKNNHFDKIKDDVSLKKTVFALNNENNRRAESYIVIIAVISGLLAITYMFGFIKFFNADHYLKHFSVFSAREIFNLVFTITTCLLISFKNSKGWHMGIIYYISYLLDSLVQLFSFSNFSPNQYLIASLSFVLICLLCCLLLLSDPVKKYFNITNKKVFTMTSIGMILGLFWSLGINFIYDL